MGDKNQGGLIISPKDNKTPPPADQNPPGPTGDGEPSKEVPKVAPSNEELLARFKGQGNPHARSAEESEEYQAQGPHQNYQSDDARESMIRSRKPVVEEPKLAMVGAHRTQKKERGTVRVTSEDMNKIVKVKPNQTIPRFRIGKQWYQITAGKHTLVPKHVAMLLDQRGLI